MIKRKRKILKAGDGELISPNLNGSTNVINDPNYSTNNWDILPTENMVDPYEEAYNQQIKRGKLHDYAQNAFLGIAGANALVTKIDNMNTNRSEARKRRSLMQPIISAPEYGGSTQLPYRGKGGLISSNYEVSPNQANVVTEGGEFLVLPDGMTDTIVGPSHNSKEGGVFQNLPEDTKVFSKRVKVDKDFASGFLDRKVSKKYDVAHLAKKFDVKEHQDKLDNKYTDPISRRTSSIMKEYKNAKLNDLFDYQEATKNSNNPDLMAFGGMIEAKKGVKVKNLDNDLTQFYEELSTLFPELEVTSGLRPGARTKQGKPSRHAVGSAIDVRPNPKVFQYLTKTPEGLNLMDKYGVGLLDETTKDVMNKTGATGPHYHIGKDSTIRGNKRYKQALEDDYKPNVFQGTVDPKIKKEYDAYKANPKDKNTVLAFQRKYAELYPDLAKEQFTGSGSKNTNLGRAKGLPDYDVNANLDGYDGPITKSWIKNLETAPLDKPVTDNTPVDTPAPDNKIVSQERPNAQYQYANNIAKPGTQNEFMGDNSIIDYMPDILNFAQNQTDFPIYTKKYQPKYLQPTEMNIQANLNENYSATKPLLESSTGNPAIDNARANQATSNLYNANNQVWQQKNNYDTQSRAQTDQYNNGLENQAENTNFARLDNFWNKVTQRKAIKDANNYSIADSIYGKYKKKLLENRSLALTKQLFDNFKYGEEGIYFDPKTGMMFSNPNDLGLGQDANPNDNLRTTTTTSSSPRGTRTTIKNQER